MHKNVNLITLVSLGSYDLVKQKLYEESWDPNVQNEDGTTPALRAAERNDLQILQLLIDKGAKMDTADKMGFTPIDLARRNENKDMIELINDTINNSKKQQSKRPKTEMNPPSSLFYGFNAANAPLFQKKEIGTTNRPNRENLSSTYSKLVRTGTLTMSASRNVRYPNDVVIEGLHMNVNETKLREQFKSYGKIIRVNIPKTKPNAQRRIAFITFENREVALKIFHFEDDATQHRKLRDKVTSDNDITPYHYGYQFM